MMPYIKLFGDTASAVDFLTDEEAGRLLKAILGYANGKNIELCGQEKLVFAMLRTQIDRDASAYEAFCEKQKANGSKGGRPRKPTGLPENPKNPVVLINNPKNPTVFSKTQKSQDKDKEYINTTTPLPPSSENLDDVLDVQNEIIAKMEDVGIEITTASIDRVMDMVSDHGKEAVMYALDECVGVTGNKLRYMQKVVENYGNGKPKEDDGRLDDEFLKTVVWG